MPRFTIVNRLDWHPVSILQNRRHRWSVEIFHQEGNPDSYTTFALLT